MSALHPGRHLTSLVEGLLDIGEDHLATASYGQATKALRGIKGVVVRSRGGKVPGRAG